VDAAVGSERRAASPRPDSEASFRAVYAARQEAMHGGDANLHSERDLDVSFYGFIWPLLHICGVTFTEG
jgi:hypothetical protein